MILKKELKVDKKSLLSQRRVCCRIYFSLYTYFLLPSERDICMGKKCKKHAANAVVHSFGVVVLLWFIHGDVIKWKHFPRYWPFVRAIHWSSMNSPHKGQRRGALVFSLICAWINGWANNREAGDLRCHRAHYDVSVMQMSYWLYHQLAHHILQFIDYNDVIMSAMTSEITSLTIVCTSIYSGADQRKHQSSASLAFVWGIHRWPVNSPRKGPVTRKMFPFDDVIITRYFLVSLPINNFESTAADQTLFKTANETLQLSV